MPSPKSSEAEVLLPIGILSAVGALLSATQAPPTATLVILILSGLMIWGGLRISKDCASYNAEIRELRGAIDDDTSAREFARTCSNLYRRYETGNLDDDELAAEIADAAETCLRDHGQAPAGD